MRKEFNKAAGFDRYKWFHHSFPNYSWDMYIGNEPCGHDVPMANGDYGDRWEFVHGSMHTYNGEVLDAQFSINKKITIYIIGDTLNVVDNRRSSTFDQWLYCNNDKTIYGTMIRSCRHPLEKDKLEQILNCEISNCKAWDIIQKRAKELATADNYWEGNQ